MRLRLLTAAMMLTVVVSGCTYLPGYIDSPAVQADLRDCKSMAAESYKPAQYVLGGTLLGFLVGGTIEALDKPRCEGRHSGSRYYDRPCPAGYDPSLFVSSDGSDGSVTSAITGLGTLLGIAEVSRGRTELVKQCMYARGHLPY